MNTKKALVFTVAALLMLSLSLAAQKAKADEAQKSKPSQYLAPQVAAIFDADVAARKVRSDIPLTYLRTFYLPAQLNQMYPAFIFQMKNSDLGFSAAAETPEMLNSQLHVFTRLYRIDNGALGPVVREGHIPFNQTEAKATFQPEAVNYYSIAGDIFPAGNYLLAMAVSTLDYSRISTCYNEFTLPDVAQLKNKLSLTPVFSILLLQQLPAPDTKVSIYKNSFVYNTLVLGPKMSDEYKASENLDLFYCALGAMPDKASNTYSIQHAYKFKKDGKEVLKLAPITSTSFIISQPIPFSISEVSRDARGKERGRSEKLLEPGEYVLEIEILDNVSKASAVQELKFKIVQ